MGQKRKRSCSRGKKSENECDVLLNFDPSAPPKSSSKVEVNHLQPVDAGEGGERRSRKRRRTESPSGQPVKVEDRGAALIGQRSTEDQGSVLKYDLQEPHISGLEVHLSVDEQQVQPPSQVTKGDILSHYEVGKKLGEGGFGAVFEGIRLKDGLEVALKFALKTETMEYISIPGHPTPLPLEVALTILANRGPSVPQIIQLLEWEDQVGFYIMVLERPSPCKDLFDFLQHQGGTLSEQLARLIMWQVVHAAHMCCRRGVLHRDIKLENLLFNKDTLEVKLIDFGCGDLLNPLAYKTFHGTEIYCPPEYEKHGQYHGKSGTVWSLGIVLFELLCGGPPDSNDRDMTDKHLWSKPGLSEECCHLIQSCLQTNPKQRLGLGKIILHDWFKVDTSGPDLSYLSSTASSSENSPSRLPEIFRFLTKWLLPCQSQHLCLGHPGYHS